MNLIFSIFCFGGWVDIIWCFRLYGLFFLDYWVWLVLFWLDLGMMMFMRNEEVFIWENINWEIFLRVYLYIDFRNKKLLLICKLFESSMYIVFRVGVMGKKIVFSVLKY